MSKFETVNNAALTSIERILSQWLPGGKKQGKEYVVKNPNRSDQKEGSFSINLNTGIWADFASADIKGSDLISLIAFVEGVKQGEACDQLASFLGIDTSKVDQKKAPSLTKRKTNEWIPITPVPDDAPPPLDSHYRHGKYSSSWRYVNESGKLLCLICRFDKPDGKKEIMPLTYCRSTNDQKAWRWKGLAAPRPLYNLDQLSKRKGDAVIITEGEKAADAAAHLFPDCVISTMLNGSQAPHKTDWTPLQDRKVILWSDNDPAGKDCMDKVSGLFKAKKLALMNLDYFLSLPGGTRRELPEKWDAADALLDGFTADHCKNFFKDGKNFKTIDQTKIENKKPDRQKKNTATSSPVLFQLIENNKEKADGVYYFGHDRSGQPIPPQFICQPLHVTAHTRDKNNTNWGYLLEWQDRDSKQHAWAMPSQMTSGSGEEYRRILLDGGLGIAPGQAARNHLTSYILSANTLRKAQCTETTGWHEALYVLPDRTLGSSDQKVIYQSASGNVNTFRQQHSLEDWQENISRLCIGNSRLIFAVSAAFAGMLIGLVDEDSCGLHYRGDSSTGKTTALRVAASVFGGKDYLQRWRSTDNALESLAAQYCDATLILDELAQIDPNSAGQISYMLANGSGKARANRNGTARPRISWRLLYLSAGEIGLAEHMAQAGKKVRAGQEIRLLDIPVDAGAGMGMFEELHDQKSPAAFSRTLNHNATEYYGEAALSFIGEIQKHFDDIPDIIKAARKAFVDKHVPHEASGQVHRAALQFALVGAAGELATRFGITNWAEGEAMRSATICFDAWVASRGGVGNQEESAMLAQFDQFFELHGESRFTDWDRTTDKHAPRTINRAGFRYADSDTRKITYYVFPQVFNSEIAEGFDSKAMARTLVEKGYISPSRNGSPSRTERVPGIGVKRCYVISWGDQQREE